MKVKCWTSENTWTALDDIRSRVFHDSHVKHPETILSPIIDGKMMGSKMILIALSTLISFVSYSVQHPAPYLQHSYYPNRTIAGVTVIDTPLVQAAQRYAQLHTNDAVYKHIMRSWLFGALMVHHNETLKSAVDLEVHAVAALLHDLGWDQTPGSPIISPDRRFEVDGAMAARAFIRAHEDGKNWDERRVQLVWDSIALHTERRISYFKELDVQVTSKGIKLDFDGPELGVTKEEYDNVLQEFPNMDLKNGVNESIIWLCQTKPSSTYGKSMCVY
jgi:hypothetical protein